MNERVWELDGQEAKRPIDRAMRRSSCLGCTNGYVTNLVHGVRDIFRICRSVPLCAFCIVLY